MERDFLGLVSSKNIPFTIKQETTDDASNYKDHLVSMKGSTMQWSFSNKVSAIPQFLSFESVPEAKPRKTSVLDSLSSSAFNPISTANAFDSTQKPFSGVVQKNMNLDKQGTSLYAPTTYSVQQYPIQCPQKMRIFPVSNQQNQSITVSMGSPILQSRFASTGHNVIGNTMKSQSLGEVPIISPVSVHPAPSSIIGTTDLRNGSKPSVAPAQLTIFYAGSVCVYNDISPEKAQAIMLLAGNGASATQNKMLSPPQVQSTITRPNAGDGYNGNKVHTASPCSGFPSPISVTSNSSNELAIVKPVRALSSASNQAEAPKAVTTGRPGSATLIPAGAVPQARKASLARFLEKRKERVMTTSPYTMNKKSPDCISIGSENVSLSMNSVSYPSHQLAVKGGFD